MMFKKACILFPACFLMIIQLYANVVTVKGYVRRADGTPVANKSVKIAVYLAGGNASCSEQSVVTNDAGFYTRELSCTGDLRMSRISLADCNEKVVVQEKEITSSKVVESNFIICEALPAVCAAKFTAEVNPVSTTVGPFSFKFNSISSEVGNGDNIIHRTWDFRDGTAVVKDRVDPLHTFPRAGNYEVCLSITTKLGCESKVCKQVTVKAAEPVTCNASFTFEKVSIKKIRFNSTTSSISSNDQIIERKWDFRDGSTSDDTSPLHEFGKAGNYEVCLQIKTAKGCVSRSCSVVKIEEIASSDPEPVRIISVYPSPVLESFKTVIYSKHTNVAATIAVVNAFGIVQYTKKVNLGEGYNPFTIEVNRLIPGSYYMTVTTFYGVVNRGFYKM